MSLLPTNGLLRKFYTLLEELLTSVKEDVVTTEKRRSNPIIRAIFKRDLGTLQTKWKDKMKFYHHMTTGMTFLHMAVMKGDLDIVKFFIEKGMDANETAYTRKTNKYSDLSCVHLAVAFKHTQLLPYLKSSECSFDDQFHVQSDIAYEILNGMTPLHFAVLVKNAQIFNLLLDWNAAKNAQTYFGLTPLHIAAILNQDEIAQILLKRTMIKELCCKDGSTPAFLAACHNSQDVLSKLLQHGYKLDVVLPSGYNAIHAAVENNAVDSIPNLVKLGCEIDSVIDKFYLLGRHIFSDVTALHLAVDSGKRYCVEALLKAGADPNKSCVCCEGPEEIKNLTPLHLAAKNQSEFTCRLLIEHGAKMDVLDSNRDSPLRIAVRNRDARVVKLLLQENCDVNLDSGAALADAVIHNSVDIVRLLLTRCGVNTECGRTLDTGECVFKGMTPLHIAVDKGNKDIVRVLLQHSADPRTTMEHGDRRLLTMMHTVAVYHGDDVDLARIIQRAGCPVDEPSSDGITPLMLAAKLGHLNLIRFLLDHGADINRQDHMNLTSLLVAIRDGKDLRYETVKLLIKKGCDLNKIGLRGSTALHNAIVEKDADITHLLINSGCDVDIEGNEFSHDGFSEKSTPLSLAIQLWEGKMLEKLVTKLLKKGANPMAWYNTIDDTMSPLHAAAKHERVNVIKILLRYGAKINATSDLGATPLYTALLEKKEKAAQILIRKGANLHLPGILRSPFHQAIDAGFVDTMDLLADFGCDIFSPSVGLTRKLQTPVSVACSEPTESLLERLIRLGADVNTPSEKTPPIYDALRLNDMCYDGTKTLLQYGTKVNATYTNEHAGTENISAIFTAVEMGNYETARLLLQAGADVFLRGSEYDRENRLPIFPACEMEEKNFVQLLLNHGADLDSRDSWDFSVLHYAAYGVFRSTMDYLMKCGAYDVDGRGIIDATTEMTPLHVLVFENYGEPSLVRALLRGGADVNAVCRLGNEEVSAMLECCVENLDDVLQILIRCGADINIRTPIEGETPLFKSIEFRHPRCFNLLMEAGSDVNIPNKFGITPLIEGTMMHEVEMVRALLAAGCDVNAKCKTGEPNENVFFEQFFCYETTALHVAAEMNQIRIAKMLIEAGANLSAREIHHDVPGFTPLHSAIAKGNTDMVKLLVNSNCDVNAQTDRGWTALHQCAQKGDSSMAQVLNSLGINPVIRDKDGHLASALSTDLHFTQQLVNYELACSYRHQQSNVLRRRLSLHQRLSVQNLGLFNMNSSNIEETPHQDAGMDDVGPEDTLDPVQEHDSIQTFH